MEQERDNLSQQNAEEIIGTAVYIETEIEIPRLDWQKWRRRLLCRT